MENKKVFIGSLYEFGPEARATVIDEYREQLSADAAKPFVSYDERNHLFSFTCDRTETAAVSNFFSSLYAYTEVFEKKKPEDFVDSPKLKPMPGTAVVDALAIDAPQQLEKGLFDAIEDSDSGLDEPIAPSAPANLHWTPAIGSSKILTRDIARAITEATEASLFPEHDRNRVVIFGANAADAVQKLKTLELLMETLSQQSKEGGDRPSSNVLMLPHLGDLSTLHFKPVHSSGLAIERIVVEQRHIRLLANKSLSQILHRKDRHGEWLEQENLLEPSIYNAATPTKGFSQVWARASYPTFGNPESANPSSASVVEIVPTVLPPQKYVTALKADAITRWTDDIDGDVDPQAIAVEAPSEIPTTRVRQRNVQADSDDEGEVGSEITPPLATNRVVAPDSDDEAEERVASVAAAEDAVAATEPVTSVPVVGASTSDNVGKLVTGWDDGVKHANDPNAPLLAPRQSPPLKQRTKSTNQFSSLLNAGDEAQNHISKPESASVGLSLLSSQIIEPCLQPVQRVGSPRLGTDYLGNTSPSEMLAASCSPAARNQSQRGSYDRPRGVYAGRGSPSAPRAGFSGIHQAPKLTTNFRPRDTGCENVYTSYNHAPLLDLSTTPASPQHMPPPPGLGIRTDLVDTSRSTQHLLDGPLENIQHPSIKPIPNAAESPQEPHSASTRKSSSIQSARSGAEYVNTHNPPLNLAKIEDDCLAELMKLAAEEKEKKRLQKAAGKPKPDKSSHGLQSHLESSSNGTQRIQSQDEMSTRKFHNTMKQKGRNPGLKGKQNASKKMTEKEKQQKLKELLGEPTSLVPPTKTMPSDGARLQSMSIRKQQALLKNPELDPETAAKLAESQPMSRQTYQVIELLKPIFQTGRGFRGDLKFELQLGQVLMANSKDLVTGDVQLFGIKKWESFFGTIPGKQATPTTFTNILTRNGHDVDRLLKLEPRNSPAAQKLFDESIPGPSTISYEFHCQSQHSEEFWIIVDQTGNYQIRRASAMIGTVNLHYPQHIWDARAVLHGTAGFCEAEEQIAEMVASFMETVYVAGQDSLSITFRQPTDNDMTVHNVIVKRTSLHNCLLLDYQEIQLQVTEVKALYHRFHKTDTKLSQAFEKGFAQMLEQDRIHYEASLVHTVINDSLVQNRTIEIGTLTPERIESEKLLSFRIIHKMLALASQVVSQADWVGVHNQGSLMRQAQEEHNLATRIAETTFIPGTRVPQSLNSMALNGTGVPGIRVDIPGVRINTKAELGCDADGKPVLIGMGGAMIPIPEMDEAAKSVLSASELVPNDSASNIGADDGFRRQYVPNSNFARGLSRSKDFW